MSDIGKPHSGHLGWSTACAFGSNGWRTSGTTFTPTFEHSMEPNCDSGESKSINLPTGEAGLSSRRAGRVHTCPQTALQPIDAGLSQQMLL